MFCYVCAQFETVFGCLKKTKHKEAQILQENDQIDWKLVNIDVVTRN